jgi:hypothetical protein
LILSQDQTLMLNWPASFAASGFSRTSPSA